MVPPPPPPPPAPETPPTPPVPAGAAGGPPKVMANGGDTPGDHNEQLMAAIRNGINLKPTKTNDRSTPGFIKQSNGVLNDNEDPATPAACDRSSSIDEMKDALQAELRNTLKRKIKKQELEQGDCRVNDEIERSIENTRNEVQLKLNDASPAPQSADAPKVDNPMKTILDIVDKERSAVPVTPPKQPSPVMTQKTVSTPSGQPLFNGSATLRKVSATQNPAQNGNTIVINVNTTGPKTHIPTMNASKTTVTTGNGDAKVSPGSPNNVGLKTTTTSSAVTSPGTLIPNGSAVTAKSPPIQQSVTPKVNASPATTSLKATPVASTNVSYGSVKMANGSVPTGSVTNGASLKVNSIQAKPPSSSPSSRNIYSNTLPRANGTSPKANGTPVNAAPNASPSGVPAAYTSSVKLSIGTFGGTARSNGGSPVVRSGKPANFQPLTIDTSSNGGSSPTNGSESPTTPKELLSPQVRSGAAAIRPSQIRTLTKAGSVVSHTDILETSKPIAKLPVTLIEPAPVLTAAAAVSPPPKASTNIASLSVNSTPATTPPAKERSGLFEKANKDPPKSPLNRWADGGSLSGGTARKLLLTHGRPNFTIKRSNSRQGFDVDVPDTKTDTVKPVFRILTDLEKMENQQEQQEQQQGSRRPSAATSNGTSPPQAYVSFAKDLSNAPNNHPDVVVVTKTIPSSTAPVDPFLANLKDIKINIGEMKVVNAKEV